MLQKSYIDNNGKLAIPIKIRKQLKLKSGDEVQIRCGENELIVTTFMAPLEKARSIVAKYTEKSLAEELKVMREEDGTKE